jgi:transitional endoplasmic reticulum ATPase
LIVIGATNRPDYLDEALLRPGRFDRLVLVPPPDVAARAAIFSVHTRAIQLAQDVDLQELAQCSAGFSGADIASVCQAAALMALDNDHDAEVVPMRYFSAAIEDTVTAINMDSSWLQKYSQFAR